MEVRFKQVHENGKLPTRNNDTDTGYDIYAAEDVVIPRITFIDNRVCEGSNVVETGIELAYIESGYWFLILPRSGMGFKHSMQPHLGTIDNGYRGNLNVKLYNFSSKDYIVEAGDRIAQMAFFPLVQPTMVWTDTKTETNRGANRLGSSGK